MNSNLDITAPPSTRGETVHESMTVARGGGGGGKPEARQWRQSLGGSGGLVPQKIVKFRSPEMPFPEAISSSYLIQVMIF